MKRLACVLGGVALLVLGLFGIAAADNGPHGGYAASTDACAACHRAHTAPGVNLLMAGATSSDTSGFCYTCHANGTGAYTDVRNGMFLTTATVPASTYSTTLPSTSSPLKGGGFAWVTMNAGLTGTLHLATTSSHEVAGGTTTVWGYGAISPTTSYGAGNIRLTCTNCHSPHGRAGTGNAPTYRLLKGGRANNSPLFADGTITATATVDIADDFDPRVYYIDGTNYYGHGQNPGSYFGEHAMITLESGGMLNAYAPMTRWCAQCHTRYKADQAAKPGSTASGDAVFKYRHTTNYTSSSGCSSCHDADPTYQKRVPGCLVCHVAHGTGARMGAYSAGIGLPDPSQTPSDGRSSLLRLDNRGVCEKCHQK